MGLYLISYDLNKPGRNYQPVYDILHNWGAVRLLESVWLVSINATSATLRDTLRAQMDSNDAVAVIQLQASSSWGTVNTQSAGTAWLKKYMP